LKFKVLFQLGIVCELCIMYVDAGRHKIRCSGCSVLPTATLSTKIKLCLLMTAVFLVHTADRYGAYRYFRNISLHDYILYIAWA